MPDDSKTMQLFPTLSREDSPARTSPWRESRAASKQKDQDSGMNSADLLATYDRASQSWRTSQTCLLALANSEGDGLARFSETWPRSGLMRNGTAYHLPTLVAGPGGTESGYLPTPTAVSDSKGSPRNRFYGSDTYRSVLREYLRDGAGDPIYPNPNVSEVILGYPADYTLLETQYLPKSLQLLDEQLLSQADEP